jgi:hypothetical protein
VHDSCTSSREPAQHTWPWLKKMPSTMPSMAWSIGASSKTMLAALPPSSRVSRLRCRRAALDRLADRGRAGEGDLVDVVVGDEAAPVSPAPVTMLTTPGRQVGLLAQLGEQQRGQRGGLGRLEHDRVAAASAGAIFQASISSGKFHGMTCPATPSGAGRARARPSRACRPSRRGRRSAPRGGHVDVAGLADRLAVVERLEHGELAGPLLQQPGDAVEVLARSAPGSFARPGTPCARRLHRAVDVAAVASATSARCSSVAGLMVAKLPPSAGRRTRRR